MSNKFKAGDKVRVIDNTNTKFNINDEFTVCNSRIAFSGSELLMVEEDTDEYFARRFELVRRTPEAIDFSRPLMTRNGDDVVIKFTDGMGNYPVVGYTRDTQLLTWTPQGEWTEGCESGNDLVYKPIPKISKSTTIYMRLFADGEVTITKSLKQAKAPVHGGSGQKCIAVIERKFDITEGEFDIELGEEE